MHSCTCCLIYSKKIVHIQSYCDRVEQSKFAQWKGKASVCSVIKGIAATGERRNQTEKQKKGKREGGSRQTEREGGKGNTVGPHLDLEQRQDVHAQQLMQLCWDWWKVFNSWNRQQKVGTRNSGAHEATQTLSKSSKEKQILTGIQQHGLHHGCVPEPPAVVCPLLAEVMRTPGKPWRAGRPDRVRQTRKRSTFYRDESSHKLRGTRRGRVAQQPRRGGWGRVNKESRLKRDECANKLWVLLLNGAEYHSEEWEHMGIATCRQRAYWHHTETQAVIKSHFIYSFSVSRFIFHRAQVV